MQATGIAIPVAPPAAAANAPKAQPLQESCVGIVPPPTLWIASSWIIFEWEDSVRSAPGTVVLLSPVRRLLASASISGEACKSFIDLVTFSHNSVRCSEDKEFEMLRNL